MFNPLFEEIPAGLQDVIESVTKSLASRPDLARMFPGCLLNSWQTSMHESTVHGGDPEIFLLTGDIEAMWLRDSAAQVRPYLVAARDEEVYRVLSGVIARQARCVLIDAYANAFNDGPTGKHGHDIDLPPVGEWIWERKYEVDSLCAPLHLGYALWKASGRTDHFEGNFRAAAERIIDVWRIEQDHDARSEYTFIRPSGPWKHDTLTQDGKGGPVAVTGMTWSGFRPSDDRCDYGYLVPSNAMAVTALVGLAEIAREVWQAGDLAAQAEQLASEIDRGIRDHAVVDVEGNQVFAYEVDGLGGVNLMDDANLPSLLGLPLTGWVDVDDPLYQATRNFVLSDANPYFFAGSALTGIGSPHTDPNYVWPIAVAVAGLTGSDADRDRAADMLAETTAGTDLMHESVDADDPTKFTRPWFGWANSVFAELVLAMAGFDIAGFYPRKAIS